MKTAILTGKQATWRVTLAERKINDQTISNEQRIAAHLHAYSVRESNRPQTAPGEDRRSAKDFRYRAGRESAKTQIVERPGNPGEASEL